MSFTTIGCGEARRQKIANLTICRECGIQMKCPNCENGSAHVEGIEYNEYNELVDELSPTLEPYLIQSMHMRVEKDFKIALEEPEFQATMQLVSTLFEVIAAMAALDPSTGGEERRKLDILRRHAIEGINLIDAGAEAEEPQ